MMFDLHVVSATERDLKTKFLTVIVDWLIFLFSFVSLCFICFEAISQYLNFIHHNFFFEPLVT